MSTRSGTSKPGTGSLRTVRPFLVLLLQGSLDEIASVLDSFQKAAPDAVLRLITSSLGGEEVQMQIEISGDFADIVTVVSLLQKALKPGPGTSFTLKTDRDGSYAIRG